MLSSEDSIRNPVSGPYFVVAHFVRPNKLWIFIRNLKLRYFEVSCYLPKIALETEILQAHFVVAHFLGPTNCAF